ncbi:MAG: hypothetical protein CMG04_08655 [Candidatus Marinimicrobia bacterium]|nr:hypothetical protein [Candidatus Neomarinimicrobiota bacterium]
MLNKSKKISLDISKEHLYLKNKLIYVIDLFESVYSINKPLRIVYGSHKKGDINISPGDVGTFFEEKAEIPKYTFQNWDNKKIPFLFSPLDFSQLDLISGKSDSKNINLDIFMSSFYILSCWQEYVSDKEDEMGRFPFKESFLKFTGVYQIPVVNYYFDILASVIKDLPNYNIDINPIHQRKLKIGITHDIDNCQTGSVQDAYREFLSGNWYSSVRKIFQRLIKEDIWYNFEDLLKIEKKYGIYTSYFFITENNPKNGYPNADYLFHSKKIQILLKKIRNDGHEVGIHGSIGSGFDKHQLNREITKFPFEIFGGRFHYLMMRLPKSFQELEESNIRYDASLGFAESVSFRNGFCFPYQPYNNLEDKPFSFVEFPFQLMDKTLIQNYYMGFSPENAMELVKNMIDEIAKFSGYFNLIWHNNTITGYKYEKWKKVLIYIIKYGKEKKSEFQSLKTFYDRLTN